MKSFKEGFDEFLDRYELKERFITKMDQGVKFMLRDGFVHGGGFLLELLTKAVAEVESYEEFEKIYKQLVEKMKDFDKENAEAYKKAENEGNVAFSGWKKDMQVKTKEDQTRPVLPMRHLLRQFDDFMKKSTKGEIPPENRKDYRRIYMSAAAQMMKNFRDLHSPQCDPNEMANQMNSFELQLDSFKEKIGTDF